MDSKSNLGTPSSTAWKDNPTKGRGTAALDEFEISCTSWAAKCVDFHIITFFCFGIDCFS